GNLEVEKSVYAGNPARFIRQIYEPLHDKYEELRDILIEYGFRNVKLELPNILIDDVIINVETQTITGTETIETDKLRDCLRRYGIRIYTDRPFVSPA